MLKGYFLYFTTCVLFHHLLTSKWVVKFFSFYQGSWAGSERPFHRSALHGPTPPSRSPPFPAPLTPAPFAPRSNQNYQYLRSDPGIKTPLRCQPSSVSLKNEWSVLPVLRSEISVVDAWWWYNPMCDGQVCKQANSPLCWKSQSTCQKMFLIVPTLPVIARSFSG